MISEDDAVTEIPPRAESLRRHRGSSPSTNAEYHSQHSLQNDVMFPVLKRPQEPGRVGCPYKPISISHRNSSAGARASPDRFYDSQSSSPYISHLLRVSSAVDGFHRKNILLSNKLPGWIWSLLARSLGLQLTHNERPLFALFLHVITLTAAFAFGISGVWFKIYDIKSEFSKTTVLIGSVSILIGFGWMLFGIYAHKLAATLFSNKNFVKSVRMHSKTFLKISITLIVVILSFMVVVVNLYSDFDLYHDKSCLHIQLSPVVCKVMYISRVVYSFFCVTWNLLVAFVLLSVCRTHTIGIRRFMRELAVDAQVFETYWTQHVLGVNPVTQGQEVTSSTEEWFMWEDPVNGDTENIEDTSEGVFLESISGSVDLQTTSSSPSPPISDKPTESHDTDLAGSEEQKQSGETGEENSGVHDNKTTGSWDGPLVLTNDDLLFSYWKIYSCLSMTSQCLQRWLFSWISFMLIWCADYIIYWTSHDATLTGILEFIVPLILLLIISSAYAEVNAEGQRMLKCICPMEERLPILFFLNQQPLQMQVFGFTISYNAIMTVILAFSVAFASRIVLDEVLN